MAGPLQPVSRGGLLGVAGTDETALRVNGPQVSLPGPESEKTEQERVALADYLKGIWDQNYKHKLDAGVQDRMLANLRARDSMYESAQLNAINQAASADVYMGLTGVKCGHAEAWLHDIFSSSERTWGLKPTPVPSLAPQAAAIALRAAAEKLLMRIQSGQETVSVSDLESAIRQFRPLADQAVQEIAEQRAKKMESKIADQMAEGGWDEAFEDFLSDLITLKLGILKGPIVRRKKVMQWVESAPGTFVEQETVKLVPEFATVSPLDFFPSPNSSNVQKGNLAERVKFSRAELIALKAEDGYIAENIDKALEEFRTAVKVVPSVDEAERKEVEQKEETEENVEYRETVDGVEYWASVQGQMLKEYGMETDLKGAPLEDLAEYQANVIVVNELVIYVDLNQNPLEERPYSVWGWKKVPGSIWFKGVPELMIDLQRVCNAAVRSLVNNMAICAGPQAEVDTSRIPPGEDLENIYALKIWQTVSKGGNVNVPAVRFFNPESNASELIMVYEKFAQMADDYTGIPAYAFGSDRVAGAGRTSSGLSMLMTASARGIKRVILGIDRHVMKTVVRRMFNYNMKYDPDPELKGDMNIVTTGAVGLMIKEQLSERRMEFLNATNNPTDLQLMGLEGRAHMLREASGALETDTKAVVKSEEEIKRMQIQQTQQAQQQGQAQQQLMAQQQQQLQQQSAFQEQSNQLELQQKYVGMQAQMAELRLKQQEMERKMLLTQTDVEVKQLKAQADHVKSQVEATGAGLNLLAQTMQMEGGVNEGVGQGSSGSAGAGSKPAQPAAAGKMAPGVAGPGVKG